MEMGRGGAWVPEYMDWKYWDWPNLAVPEVSGPSKDNRRFGWPAEQITRVRAELAAGILDCHYKHSRAVEEGPAQASAPLPTLPERRPAPTLHTEEPPAEGGRSSASGSNEATAPAEGGGE
eukprot:2076770-Alexandrium_andersonii.AAC.1